MAWCGPPSIDVLLANWWGGGCEGFAYAAGVAQVSNLAFGGNPVYQISDFLAFYPKFGTFVQAITAAQPNSVTPGSGYQVGDLLTVVQADASKGILNVLAVNSGVPTQYGVSSGGAGYSVATGLATTGGHGTGALIDILSIAPFYGKLPQVVLQAYINLASASLQMAKWQASWPIAMAYYVAHFATLYLQSEANPTSDAGQIAQSGLGKGIAVSKAAGDVSVSYETVIDQEWGAWNLTSYGQQLVTLAKVVGMGAMYVL